VEDGMNGVSKEDGVAVALLERFEKVRLPRALEIKQRVDRGELLSDTDIAFLEQVMRDAEEVHRLVDKQPGYQQLYARAVGLYQAITKQALENEQNS
jgi:hypothetical protein